MALSDYSVSQRVVVVAFLSAYLALAIIAIATRDGTQRSVVADGWSLPMLTLGIAIPVASVALSWWLGRSEWGHGGPPSARPAQTIAILNLSGAKAGTEPIRWGIFSGGQPARIGYLISTGMIFVFRALGPFPVLVVLWFAAGAINYLVLPWLLERRFGPAASSKPQE
jgi:hypothetical protein